MATIRTMNKSIVDVPQGFSLACAFSTDMNWVGLPGIMDDVFNISFRDNASHKVGSLSRIDNLYMLFVKESSYDKPAISDIKKCLSKLAKKMKKNRTQMLAMPRICCGRNGHSWDDILPLIEEAFEGVDIYISICVPE